MSFKIERALTALFKVLKLRSQGNLPYEMTEVVQPTFDLNWWTLQAISPSVAEICPVTAGTVVGQTVTYVQPSDWLVTQPWAVGISAIAGEYLLPQVLWQPDGNSGVVVVADCRRWGAAANHTAGNAGEFYTATPVNTFDMWFSPAGAIWSTRVNLLAVSSGPTFQARVVHYDLARN